MQISLCCLHEQSCACSAQQLQTSLVCNKIEQFGTWSLIFILALGHEGKSKQFPNGSFGKCQTMNVIHNSFVKMMVDEKSCPAII